MRVFMGFASLAAIGAMMLTLSHSNADAARIAKYCQGDRHMHYGSGSGRTKKAARRAAIQSWVDFTVFEYGSAYGRFKNARFRRTTCSKDGSSWSCSVEGNPCRRARR